MAGKYLLTTLGCKVNQYESQQIRQVLESFGLAPGGPDDELALAVVNTCAVTTAAVRKNRQAVRRAVGKRHTPIVVVGCGASADADRLRKLPGVTAVLGHDVDVCDALRHILLQRLGLSSIRDDSRVHENSATCTDPDVPGYDQWMKPADAQPRQEASTSRTSTVALSILPPSIPLVKSPDALTARIESFHGHQRAFLKVQDGCDAHCTYCIIPRLRSRLRSKPVEIAVAEARDLVRAGHREIVVTGIFLGAYGRETAIRKRWGCARSPLSELVDALARVEGLARLRLSSLEPGDVDDSLLDVLAAHETCVPHLHLPLQSGSPTILRRMNRQYTADDFVEMIDRVRAALDRPAISTDIIVGFPGETDRDFEATLDAARYAGFSKIHTFPFSPREKTAAARWQKAFVPSDIVRERMKRIELLEAELSLAFRRRFVGEVERVIVESNAHHQRDFEQPDPQSRTHTTTTPRAADGNPRGLSPADRSAELDAITIPLESPLPDRRSASTIQRGRADRYFEIHFDAPDVRPGNLVQVRVERVTPTRTHGRVIDREPTGL